MTDEDKQLLDENGWTVECESPFEIRNGESFATNVAAESILDGLKTLEKAYDARPNGFCVICSNCWEPFVAKPGSVAVQHAEMYDLELQVTCPLCHHAHNLSSFK